ncbi:MAG TPA: hypothetical protein ENJ34_00370 [Epsilonproteobacteria bacterium]|nr:hypothetical protein [Campylobacterota bacterium]
MNRKAYKNELVVGLAILLMLVGFIYKQQQVAGQTDASAQAGNALHDIKEVIALQQVWGDKKINKKVDKLKTLVSPSKVKWQKKSKKVTATFSTLSAKELNKVVTKILNIAVVIQKLEIKKVGPSYTMEFKCKW